VQRARDRIDTIWERAAADDIDVETVGDGRWGMGDGENQSIVEPENRGTGEPENREPGGQGLVLGSEEADTSTSETQASVVGTESIAAVESLESKIQHLKSRIQRLGMVNPLALEEYDEAAERHTFLTNQTGDLRQAEQSLRELIAELDG